MAPARRRARHRDPLDPGRPRRPASTSPTSTGSSTAPSCSASRPCRTCSAPSHPVRRPRRRRARRRRRWCRVDACQYVPHVPTDVTGWDADFVSFSAHKMCGPSGIGVLWGREELLDAMPPFLGGGEMITDVRLDGFTANELPWKFEAGTPPIAEAIGLGAAVDYLEAIGMDDVRRHEVALTAYALRTLHDRFGDDITVHGPAEPTARGGVLSFAFSDLHPHDISQVLDQEAVCVRAGHHCAKPLMRVLEVPATARASLYVYNDERDIDAAGEHAGRACRVDFFAFCSTPITSPRHHHRPSGDGRMPGLEDLYPRDHPRPLPQPTEPWSELDVPPAHRVRGFNPLCGDEIVLYVDVEDERIVTTSQIAGQGCSISQSAASMMSAAVKGTDRSTRSAR
ncbi:MAG: aminotransferase class V-fold PLP-dependent enzyme [Acidimicrobiia bacterium]|nr:aminotransferase class V-fold PLP-dependent enzyme [Acidimicrobiia bacterium]